MEPTPHAEQVAGPVRAALEMLGAALRGAAAFDPATSDHRFSIAANNRAGRIVPVFGAVHDVAGQTLYFPEQDFTRFSTYGSYGIDYGGNKGRPVPTITIDSLGIR